MKPYDRLQGWGGDSGYFRLDYNWSPAARILDDIHLGLGTPRVEVVRTKTDDERDDDVV